jgi:hypothetical protein
LIFDIFASFVPGSYDVAVMPAIAGGCLSMTWHIFTASRLFWVGRAAAKA